MERSTATSATVPAAPPRLSYAGDRRGWAVEGREAAVDFVEGVRRGWTPDDFLLWCRRRLLLRGVVRLADGVSGRIQLFEPGVERVTIPTSPSHHLDPMFAAPLGRLLETARGRVVTTLGGMLGAPLDDRFVSAAIYAGRVRRARGDSGASGWEPNMTEGEPLSTWVLALFAVDALSGREDYDRHLHVCETCGSVAFGLGGSRRRCAEHREATTAPPTSRVQRSARSVRDESLPALASEKKKPTSASGARC